MEFGQVDFGWRDAYKRMRWVPLRVEVRSQGEAFRGSLHVDFLDPYTTEPFWQSRQPLDLSAQGRSVFRTSVYAEWTEARLRLRIIDAGGQLRQETTEDLPPPIPDSVMLLATITTDQRGFSALHRLRLKDSVETRVVYLINSRLPLHARDYGSIDVLLLRERDLLIPWTDAEEAALKSWLASGGVLFMVTEAIPDTLVELLPLTQWHVYRTETPLRTDTPLALRVNQWVTGRPRPATQVAMYSDGMPLLSEKAYGLGRVLLLGTSIARVEKGWGYLVERLQTERQEWWRRTAYREHERRLRMLLLNQKRVATPILRSVSLVSALLLGGILLSGFRGLRSKWLSLSLLWAALLAVSIGMIARLSPADIQATGWAWAEVFPGTGDGSLHAVAGAQTSRSRRGRIGYSPAWSMRPLQPGPNAQVWYQEAPGEDRQIRLEFSPWRPFPLRFDATFRQTGSLNITLRAVESGLPFPLTDAYLLSPQGWCRIGRLDPGSRVDVTWQPLGTWRLAESSSSTRLAFLHILVSEGVLAMSQQQLALFGWSKVGQLVSDAPDLIQDADIFVTIHLPEEAGAGGRLSR